MNALCCRQLTFIVFLCSCLALALAPASLASDAVVNALMGKKRALMEKERRLELTIASLPDNKHLFYIELLQRSLDAIGYRCDIELVHGINYQQVIKMLEAGRLSLRWLIPTAQRNTRLTPVRYDILNGLIGHRILYIGKNRQSVYDNIKSLDDFRKQAGTAGFGAGWYDVKVWRKNRLKVIPVEREWRRIYPMIASDEHPITYISRSVIEVRDEYPQIADLLDIESRLLLIYERPFYFYLGHADSIYKDVLYDGLTAAKTSGLHEQIMQRYWGKALEYLNLSGRTKLYLQSPDQP